jgi:cell division protein FtsI (penicillin-binding protein 3)
MQQFKAKASVGIIMDVNTGEIIALSSLPDFDPHFPSRITADQRFNRATLGVYEVGSTFKAFTMAMGLESGKITMDDAYDVSKPLRVSSFTIRDFHPHEGMLSVPEIFVESSNIGTAMIALDVGESQQRAFLSSLGLLDPLQLEIPELGSPIYPSRWGKTSAVTISYGHGIAITPLHLTRAISSVTNGGVLYQASLIKRQTGDVLEGVRVVSQKTSEQMRQLMRFAVKYGTGSRAENVGYMVGGKTGTADKPTVGGYREGGVISSFVSVFPLHKPAYAMYVMYDEPKSDIRYMRMTGGVTAAVTAGQLIRRIAPILDIQPVDENRPELLHKFTLKTREYEQRTESF